MPLFTLGILFAYFAQKVTWKRIVLVAATIPLAIFANVVRIAGTGLVGKYWGTQAAEGFFHSFSGWAVFMLCAAFFGLLSIIVKYLPGGGTEKKAASISTSYREERKGIPWPVIVVSMIFILSSTFIVKYVGRVPPVPLKQSLSTFPLEFEGWRGEKSTMAAQIWEQVGGQNYVIIDYYHENKTSINLYVAYYEYQRKAGDFIHSPKLCLPGGGWFIENAQERHLPIGSKGIEILPALKLNELVISKNGVEQLVYYWYQGRERNFTSEYDAKIYLVWDGLWRRRTDGALVRLTMPLHPGVPIEFGRHIMDHFALNVSRTLGQYLP